MFDDVVTILALSLIPGLGNTRIGRIISTAKQQGKNVLDLWSSDTKEFHRLFSGMFDDMHEKMGGVDSSVLDEARDILDIAIKHDIVPITAWDNAYPKSFSVFLGTSAPPLLFVQGNMSLFDSLSGAVVGTRIPTETGRYAARKATEVLSAYEYTVISGGATGVDWTAHDAAVISGKKTIIILPQGILTYSMPGRWRYARDEGRLLLVSSYLPYAPWRTHAAVSRNALISAHAQLACIIEPKSHGGSVLTTRHAIAHQKPIFAEPITALPTTLRPHAYPLADLEKVLSTKAFPFIDQSCPKGKQTDFLQEC